MERERDRQAKTAAPGGAAVDLSVFRGLRAVIAMGDAAPAARLLAQLERLGAEVRLTRPSGDRLREAAELDPSIVFVDASTLGSHGIRLGRSLQSHPRLRWASVVRFSSHALGDGGPTDPTLVRLAIEARPRTRIDALLPERARRDPPFVVELSRIGPNRLLRALTGEPSPLRLSVRGGRAVAQLDLEAGQIRGAVWREADAPRMVLEGLPALAALLMLEQGDVRIERRERVTLENLGLPVGDALRRAAAEVPTHTETTLHAWTPDAPDEPATAVDERPPFADEASDTEVTLPPSFASTGEDAVTRATELAQGTTTRAVPLAEVEAALARMHDTPAPASRPAPAEAFPAASAVNDALDNAAPRPAEREEELVVELGGRRLTWSADDAPEPEAPVDPDHPTFIRELPLLFRMPNLGPQHVSEGPGLTGFTRASDTPSTRREGTLRVAAGARPKDRPTPYDRLEPTEPVRFARGPGAPRPRGTRPPLAEARWVALLPLLAFAVGATAVVGTWWAVRPAARRAPHRAMPEFAAAALPPAHDDGAPFAWVRTAEERPSVEVESSTPAPLGAPAASAGSAAVSTRVAEAAALPPTAARAEALLIRDDLPAAETMLTQVLHKNPLDPRAMEVMARICLRTGRSAEAVAWARQLLHLEPDAPGSHLLLGDALGASGDIVAARAEWARGEALRRGPEVAPTPAATGPSATGPSATDTP